MTDREIAQRRADEAIKRYRDALTDNKSTPAELAACQRTAKLYRQQLDAMGEDTECQRQELQPQSAQTLQRTEPTA